MGLDLTAHERLEFFLSLEEGDARNVLDEFPEGEIDRFCVLEGLAHKDPQFKPGYYKSLGRRYSFCAGSYGGYAEWRRWLASAVGFKLKRIWKGKHEGCPFYELLNNSDCEGTLGPLSCAHLAPQFPEWEARILAAVQKLTTYHEQEWFVRRYRDWAKATALAAGSGAIRYH